MPRDGGSYLQLVPSFHSASHTPTPLFRVTDSTCDRKLRSSLPFLATWYVLSRAICVLAWAAGWRRMHVGAICCGDCGMRCFTSLTQWPNARCDNDRWTFLFVSASSQLGIQAVVAAAFDSFRGEEATPFVFHVWMLDKKVTVSCKDDFL